MSESKMQEKKALDERIDYNEHPVYEIATTLREKGYQIANCIGIRQAEPEPKHSVGILKPRRDIQKSFLGIRWNKRQRALYLGTLWLDNKAKGAKNNENWILEVYGRENIKELSELVKELSEPRNVNFKVILDMDQSREESYPSDSDHY